MFISQVCCSLVVCLLASACDRWSCADLHLHARTPSVHLSQVLLFPLSSLLCFAFRFCFVLFVLFSISHSALHVLHLYFGTCCLCLYLSRCVCKRVCVFSWIMSVLFPDEAFTSSPLSFCFVPSIFTCLLNPWAFFLGPLVEVFVSFCFPCLSRCFTAENHTRGVVLMLRTGERNNSIRVSEGTCWIWSHHVAKWSDHAEICAEEHHRAIFSFVASLLESRLSKWSLCMHGCMLHFLCLDHLRCTRLVK